MYKAACIAGLLIAMLPWFGAFGAEAYVWIEGEQPSAGPEALKQAEGVESVKAYTCDGWGNASIMSEGKVLQVSLSAAEVEKYLPESGMTFGYSFTVSQSGRQSIWARIGYEWVRSPFEWRMDGGAWQTVTSLQPTATLQPIQTWCELGWLKLGEPDVASGKHLLEFRLQAPIKKEKNGTKTDRLLYMLDCVLITPDASFVPQGAHRPEAFGKDVKNAAIFTLPTSKVTEGHTLTPLNGVWQIAGWDETNPDEKSRLQPEQTLPDFSRLYWQEYRAPGSRSDLCPELAFAHRYIIRTQVEVPNELAGRGFYLDVQRSSLIASVFVNGVYAGWSKTFHAPWQIDLSGFMQSGKKNELTIVFKDAYYSLNPNTYGTPPATGWRWYWNMPPEFLATNQGIGALHDFPVMADVRSGLLEPASIGVCGSVYTEDVFVKTSVKEKQLSAEITMYNPGKQAVEFKLLNHIEPWNAGKGGERELSLPEKVVILQPSEHKSINVVDKWANPHLWWPDDPYLYRLVTSIKVGDTIKDTRLTRFGFREWDWTTDHQFRLNGIKWWLWADIEGAKSKEDYREKFLPSSHVNQARLWCKGGWWKMTRRETLDFFDETGMLVRSSGTFDGQLANYGVGLREEDRSKPKNGAGQYPFQAKTRLFDAWREQMNAWIKAERNHPSIYIWSVENEVTFINLLNLGMANIGEPEIRKGVEYVMQLDPTRPAMVDGGNCLKDESLPVNGTHYTELYNCELRDFPDAAYTREHFYDKTRPQRNAWRMVPNRPIMMGETYYADGYTPERFATLGGDQCFIGMGQTMQARGLFGQMLAEGYRWAEVSAFQFWMNSSDRRYWNSFSPVAVFCRQWNWSFGGSERVSRLLKVFNSTRYDDPITACWELKISGKKIADGQREFRIQAGDATEWEVSFTTPAIKERTEGEFILTATRAGKELFRNNMQVSLLPEANIDSIKLNNAGIGVYDPAGQIINYLNKHNIKYTALNNLEQIPDAVKLLLIGKNALTDQQATDSRWQERALAGLRVIMFDQEKPLSFQAIPADVVPTDHTGRIGFSEDSSHPVFYGLQQKDFFTWGNDHILYRNAYKKGSRGGRSLLQVDDGLGNTALLECPFGEGLYLLCQLAVAEKLETCVAARAIFNNMLQYAAAYRPLRRSMSFCGGTKNNAIALAQENLLKDTGLQFKSDASPVPVPSKDSRIAVVSATAENLKQLAEKREEIEIFCKAGNWLVLWGLTPDGLADYNRLTGVQHVIRPFSRERVVLRYPLDSLASGLTLKDVVMDTGKAMYPWMALREPDQESFSYIIDYDDIAPFCSFPTPEELNKGEMAAGVDQQPRNMVNGFTSEDNWCFTFTTILDEGHKTSFRLELPQEMPLDALRIRPSKLYHPLTKVKVFFDNDPTPIEAELPVRDMPVTEDILLNGRKAKVITLELAGWQQRGEKNIVVVDNIWLTAKRDPGFSEHIKSLLNIGGLIRYNIGTGGIVLCQIGLPQTERNPINRDKKINILATLLKNLGATSGNEKVILPGTSLRYNPVKIPDSVFNAYVTGKGHPSWFMGGKNGDLAALPVGEQRFANVDYILTNFQTSPVPTVIMLGGAGSELNTQEVKGIKVEAKADALFFLHTMQPGYGVDAYDQELLREQREPDFRIKQEQPWVFKYVINYSSGERLEIPVVYRRDIGGWLVKGSAKALSGAALAWSADANETGKQLAVYGMQFNNPHPDKEISSIDIVGRDKGKYGIPAVFAITTATAVETKAAK